MPILDSVYNNKNTEYFESTAWRDTSFNDYTFLYTMVRPPKLPYTRNMWNLNIIYWNQTGVTTYGTFRVPHILSYRRIHTIPCKYIYPQYTWYA